MTASNKMPAFLEKHAKRIREERKAKERMQAPRLISEELEKEAAIAAATFFEAALERRDAKRASFWLGESVKRSYAYPESINGLRTRQGYIFKRVAPALTRRGWKGTAATRDIPRDTILQDIFDQLNQEQQAGEV
jgi:hypothetical protein